MKSSLCDYSQVCIFVVGDITATVGDKKICTSFTRYVTHINDEHVNTSENLGIIMPMYNVTE